MNGSNTSRLINVSLRGLTLGSKSILIFLLAKLLKPSEVGLYGLLTVTISYILMAVGFDFYTYATREIINTKKSKWMAVLRDQAVFYCITYAALLPVCFFIFFRDLLPWSLALWFFPLLTLEHLAQEFNRLLVAINEPLWASFVLFLRQGLWALFAAGWMWLMPEQRQLVFVLAAWMVGVLFACIVAATRLINLDRSSLVDAINWKWIKHGARLALPFLFATLSLRALYIVDRYWIENFHGVEVLAAYVIFIGIANTIMTFLDASVFSFSYPALIAAAGSGDSFAFNHQMKHLTKQTLWITAILAVFIVFLANPLIAWLDNNVYSNHMNLLYWAVLVNVLSAISMIPHYALYARKQDREIIFSHLISLPVFAFSIYLFDRALNAAAAPAAMATAFFFLFFTKTFYFFKPLKKHNY